MTKGNQNPAFKALGLPRLRLPSRNWCIFWSILGGTIGSIVYDKYQQKHIRTLQMAKLDHLSHAQVPFNMMPRKITVFIAPPPSDYLEETLRVFRKYVKPLLNSAGLDFEIYTEERQGDIRFKVAEDIRTLRREALNPNADDNKSEHSIWNKVSSKLSKSQNTQEDEPLVKMSEKISVKDIIGITLYNKNDEVVREDQLVRSPEDAGGVICIGRGAFKEFMNGIHEGLLGPLEEPVRDEPVVLDSNELKGEKSSIVAQESEFINEEQSRDTSGESLIDPSNELKVIPTATSDEPTKEGEEDDEKPKNKGPLPFIYPEDYANAQLAPELDLSRPILDKNGVPIIYHQPVLVLRQFNLPGFIRTPERLWRFFTKRSQAEYYCSKTENLVLSRKHPMTIKDQELAVEEERDWPKKWVKSAKERNSEWVRPFEFDDRVIRHMWVVNDDVHDEDTLPSVN
ncbi:TIM22 complex subunit [Komagataella phaffii CBS 7435]|uniref:Mitochondrial import inner membrane translocase subunit TIM54 n=2 Tax=Komagataella phaffii TaxID=460519 RepID=C4QVW6_KOMPG|nr:Component of the mitochondrial Tim54p-Tim22p complex [Komagataella phaffii GS115]AOA61115.1 GQ67_02592T0 [Komagataella phaffii]CAH2446052.1 TIM22 complex subunit [Komagataella phaffii CBS 7435]AOA66478.1 GQ68_02656T0 [Komagataella phaffii GS115]CAY67389.1 Component of the mitochondrial Tim54p-Tim22p complex [Komagataella phaffii GS115]CCA36489.1 TIM22 complex subunit [Komagataella phaffii CBS 7435]